MVESFSSIQLLYGEYLLVRRALDDLITRLQLEKGSEGFKEWYAENTSPGLFLESLGTQSLFHKGVRVFVLHNMLKNKAYIEAGDDLEKALQSLDQDLHIIFIEKTEPDKRTKLYKLLAKIGSIQSFEKLQGIALTHWIQQTAKHLGITFADGGDKNFQSIAGSDLLRIHRELEKLSIYADNAPITPSVIELLSSNSMELTAFACLDALCSKNIKKALTTLHQLDFRNKQECIEFLGLMAWQFRLLIQATSLHKHYGSTWSKHLPERSFVIEKLREYVGSFTEDKLVAIFDLLVQLDKKFKTTSQDPLLLLERLFIEITKDQE